LPVLFGLLVLTAAITPPNSTLRSRAPPR
jgi:hypothetical protein